MAITIQQSPQKYSPTYNQSIFRIASDSVTVIYFDVVVLEAVTETIIAKLPLYTTPAHPQSAVVNLEKILSNYTRPLLKADQASLDHAVTNQHLSYKLEITEMRENLSGLPTEGDYFETDIFTIWEAKLSNYDYSKFNYVGYVLNNTGSARFLTTKSDTCNISGIGTELLYFIHDGLSDLKLSIQTYDNSNTLINSYLAPIDTSSKIVSLNVSPKVLVEVYPDFFDDGAVTYTVQILDEEDEVKTISRRYNFFSFKCGYEPVNLIWSNNLGGFDSYSFINPQQTVTNTKTTVKNNPYGYDADDNYSNQDGNIFRFNEKIINNNSSASFTVFSRIVSDIESNWLKGLFAAKQVYVELKDGSFLPVKITNNSYTVERQKFLKDKMNSIQVDFTVDDSIELIDIIQNSEILNNSFSSANAISDSCFDFSYVNTNNNEVSGN